LSAFVTLWTQVAAPDIWRRQCSPGGEVRSSVFEMEILACDAIVAIGEPLTYHPARIEEFLRRAAVVLPSGRMLIFDIIECGEPSLAAGTRPYRRGRETPRVRLFDADDLCAELAACGFEVETASGYGTQTPGPRRRAFFATRRWL
jgi:hypothetical protein